MTTLVAKPPIKDSRPPRTIPPLENGDTLTGSEFLRRYEAMPEVKKAELINGKVIMASPVRYSQHSEYDGLLQTWAGVYRAHTPGVLHAPNATTRLGPKDIPQPDSSLFLAINSRGEPRVDAGGYITGPPELVIEIAASSVSIDSTDKLDLYLRAQVPEYLLFQVEDSRVNWLILDHDAYIALQPDALGIIRSRIFPGLWLNVPALLNGDAAQILKTLQKGLDSPEHAAFVKELQQRAPK